MKLFIPNTSNVKLIGRSIYHNDILWCALSASGVEFTFSGKQLSVDIYGDDNSILPDTLDTTYARFAVFIDDNRIVDECITYTKKNFVILDSEKTVNATIRIIKLSEAPMSLLGIGTITADDTAIITPTKALSKKIEFIGDSITCGYGVDADSELVNFSTATEDPTKAYAYQIAKALDWDYSLVSYSGHGIISGYTEGDVPYTDELVPPFYPMIGHSVGTVNGVSITNQDWDFTLFSPDYVLINLGTNDDSYCRDYLDRQETFKKEYINFLKLVRHYNKSAKIICVLGLMGDRLSPFVNEAMNIYSKETGDDNICFYSIKPQDPAKGYGADYHPSVVSHKIAAEELLAYINSVL